MYCHCCSFTTQATAFAWNWSGHTSLFRAGSSTHSMTVCCESQLFLEWFTQYHVKTLCLGWELSSQSVAPITVPQAWIYPSKFFRCWVWKKIKCIWRFYILDILYSDFCLNVSNFYQIPTNKFPAIKTWEWFWCSVWWPLNKMDMRSIKGFFSLSEARIKCHYNAQIFTTFSAQTCPVNSKTKANRTEASTFLRDHQDGYLVI